MEVQRIFWCFPIKHLKFKSSLFQLSLSKQIEEEKKKGNWTALDNHGCLIKVILVSCPLKDEKSYTKEKQVRLIETM